MTTFSMKVLTFLRRLFGDMWRSLWKASTLVRWMPEKLVIECSRGVRAVDLGTPGTWLWYCYIFADFPFIGYK